MKIQRITFAILLSMILLHGLATAPMAKPPKTMYTVSVFKQERGKWVHRNAFTYRTADALKALRYATSIRIRDGWTASTDATFDITNYVRWDYVEKNGRPGMIGIFPTRKSRKGELPIGKGLDDVWFETKGDSNFLAFFDKTSRTRTYVEMFDPKRRMTLRIYATEAHWKVAGDKNWKLLPVVLRGGTKRDPFPKWTLRRLND